MITLYAVGYWFIQCCDHVTQPDLECARILVSASSIDVLLSTDESMPCRNDDAGVFGAVLIICGVVGAGVSGWIMERSHAYRPLLKIVFGLLVAAFVFFFFMLEPDNYVPLLISFAILGFFMLGILPVAVENSAEVSYPVDEEVSVGLLFLGGNTIGIGYVFGIQALLSDTDSSSGYPRPWLPSNIFMFGFAMLCFLLALLYHGPYRRLQHEDNSVRNDQQTESSYHIGSMISG
jgi:MFS transporter, FLVCR family, MFS-domain-containing protein 7